MCLVARPLNENEAGGETVVCLVAWPWNENEAGGDFVLIETSLLFLCKLLLINMRTASLTEDPLKTTYNDGGFLLTCLLYTSPSPRDLSTSRMPSSA